MIVKKIKEKMKSILYGGVFALVVVLFVFSIFLREGNYLSFTGWATQQEENVTVSVAGTNPVNITVYNHSLPSTTVSNDGTGNMIFYVTVTDIDGASDINDSSVRANFTRAGEAVRQNNTCVKVGADLSSTSQNYSCTIGMWYFDGAGTWNITIGATDFGNASFIYNLSTTFTLPQLQGIELSPNTITWSTVSPGQTNQTSNNDPTIINNTGNYNNTINVTAIDLFGTTQTSYSIGVGNFSIGNNTGSNAECDLPSATRLVNGTTTQINNTHLSRGNHSVGDGQTGQEQIYYCLLSVPSSIPSQTYSTALAGSWTVKLI